MRCGIDIKKNNFNLLRLFCALEVVYYHTINHLAIRNPILLVIHKFLFAVPPIPIFFMISGFLITTSYERNNDFKKYTLNRIRRVYPALGFSFLLSVLIISCLGYLDIKNIINFILWVFCQLTVFQFYNPDFLRTFGVGVMNGALWTLSVEIQFYMVVPLIYALMTKQLTRSRHTFFFWMVFIGSIIANMIYYRMSGAIALDMKDPSIFSKLFKVSLIPYFYCFILGAIIRLHFATLEKYLCGRWSFALFLTIYLILYHCLSGYQTFTFGNPFSMILLAAPAFSFVFSFRGLGGRALLNNDITYGLYVYHMLVINLFVHFHYIGVWYYLPLIIIIAILLSIFSWVYIERPALTYKKISSKTYLAIN